MNNWLHISAANLTANFHALANAAGPATEVLAVVKANAYGHGATLCAPILAQAGARWLGVTGAAEGARVRLALGSASPVEPGESVEIVLMCGFLAGDVPLILQHRLIPVVWTAAHVDSLPAGTRVHLEVDTGMGRQGVTLGAELDDLLARIAAAGLALDGFFTHFCSSEQADSALTRLQQHRFEAAVAQLLQTPARPAWLHAGNTSSLDNPPDPAWLPRLAATAGARSMVRPGLALYGYTLPIDAAAGTLPPPHALALTPVLTWIARVLSVRTLAAGETVGYNATFTASAPMRVALLPVGYADGLRRELSPTATRAGGWVMIHGQRAPILGRISMNLTVVDISSIDTASGAGEVAAGTEAVVLGPGIDAQEHARLAGTIAYEILCNLHPCG